MTGVAGGLGNVAAGAGNTVQAGLSSKDSGNTASDTAGQTAESRMRQVSWCTGMVIRTEAGPCPRSFFKVHHYGMSMRGMIMMHIYNNEAHWSREERDNTNASHMPSFTFLMD